MQKEEDFPHTEERKNNPISLNMGIRNKSLVSFFKKNDVDGLLGNIVGDSLVEENGGMINYKDLVYDLAVLAKKDSHYNDERNHWKRITGVRGRYPKAKHILEAQRGDQSEIIDDILVKKFCEGEACRYAASIDPNADRAKTDDAHWRNFKYSSQDSDKSYDDYGYEKPKHKTISNILSNNMHVFNLNNVVAVKKRHIREEEEER